MLELYNVWVAFFPSGLVVEEFSFDAGKGGGALPEKLQTEKRGELVVGDGDEEGDNVRVYE